jgi:hypothetical protein
MGFAGGRPYIARSSKKHFDSAELKKIAALHLRYKVRFDEL